MTRHADLPAEVQRSIATAVLDQHVAGTADDKVLAVVAGKFGQTSTLVATCARHFGWPDYPEMTRALRVLGSLDGLLERADCVSGTDAISEAVEQILTVAQQLASLVEHAEQVQAERAERLRMVEAKRAEVEQMQQRAKRAAAELAQLEADL